MTSLTSGIDPGSAEFTRNAAAMKILVADLRGKLEAAMQGGSEEARARHVARGKSLARERIGLLIDRSFREHHRRNGPRQRPRMHRHCE